MFSLSFLQNVLSRVNRRILYSLIRKRNDIASLCLEFFIKEDIWNSSTYQIFIGEYNKAVKIERNINIEKRLFNFIFAILTTNFGYIKFLKNIGLKFNKMLINLEPTKNEDFNIFLHKEGVRFIERDFSKLELEQKRYFNEIISEERYDEELFVFFLEKERYDIFFEKIKKLEYISFYLFQELIRYYEKIPRYITEYILEEKIIDISYEGFDLMPEMSIDLLKLLLDKNVFSLEEELYFLAINESKNNNEIFNYLISINCPLGEYMIFEFVRRKRLDLFFASINFIRSNEIFTLSEYVEEERFFIELFRRNIFPRDNFSLYHIYRVVGENPNKFREIISMIPRENIVNYKNSYLASEIFSFNSPYLEILESFNVIKSEEIYEIINKYHFNFIYIKRCYELNFPKSYLAYVIAIHDDKMEEILWLKERNFPLNEDLLLSLLNRENINYSIWNFLISNIKEITNRSYEILANFKRLDLIKILYNSRGLKEEKSYKFLNICLSKNYLEGFIWGMENFFPLSPTFQDNIYNIEFGIEIIKYLKERRLNFKLDNRIIFLALEKGKEFLIKIYENGFKFDMKFLIFLLNRGNIDYFLKLVRSLEIKNNKKIKIKYDNDFFYNFYPEIRDFLINERI